MPVRVVSEATEVAVVAEEMAEQVAPLNFSVMVLLPASTEDLADSVGVAEPAEPEEAAEKGVQAVLEGRARVVVSISPLELST